MLLNELMQQILWVCSQSVYLEVFAVDDGGPGLVILPLADPHQLESQDRAPDLHLVLVFRRRVDLDLDLDLDPAGKQCRDLPLHPTGGVGYMMVSPDVTLQDGVEGDLPDATGLHTQEEGWKSAYGPQNCLS